MLYDLWSIFFFNLYLISPCHAMLRCLLPGKYFSCSKRIVYYNPQVQLSKYKVTQQGLMLHATALLINFFTSPLLLFSPAHYQIIRFFSSLRTARQHTKKLWSYYALQRLSHCSARRTRTRTPRSKRCSGHQLLSEWASRHAKLRLIYSTLRPNGDLVAPLSMGRQFMRTTIKENIADISAW